MATLNFKRGLALVRGISPRGRVEITFSKKKYGKDYKKHAEDYYKELTIFELSSKTDDMVTIQPKDMSFEDLANGYIRQHLLNTRSANNKTYVETLINEFGKFSVVPKCGVTKQMFRKFLFYALDNEIVTPQGKTQYSASSVKKLIHYGTALFYWGIEQEVIPYDNPWKNVRNDALNKEFRRRTIVKKLYLSSEEFWEFVNYEKWSEEFRNIITVIWCTGMRRGEACQVTWDMIEGNVIRFQANQTKEGYPKDVILEKEAENIIDNIKRCSKIKSKEYVFLNSQGTPLSPKVLSAWWKKNTDLYADENEIQKFKEITIHKLRDSYRTRKEIEGIDPAVVRAQLGHRTVKMSEHYNIVDESRQQSIAGLTLQIPDKLRFSFKEKLYEVFAFGIPLTDVQGFVRTTFSQWKLTKKQ